MSQLQRLQSLLPQKRIEALLVDNPIDLYYLTGQDLSAGKLIVCPQKAILLVDGRYFEACSKAVSIPVLLLSDNALETLLVNQLSSVKNVAFCSDVTTYQSYLDLRKLVEKISFSSQGNRTISLIPSENLVKELRMIKSDDEIDLLRKAAALGYKGYEHICKILKEGISERELAAELEIFWLKEGAEGVAFSPIIAFGRNSSHAPLSGRISSTIKRSTCAY